jgi:hypothetical protein
MLPSGTETPNPLNKPGTKRLSNFFVGAWLILTMIVFWTITEPLERVLLVCLIYGSDGYFRDGIRVLSRHPPRYSNGDPIPTALDCLTWIGGGLLTIFVVLAFLALCQWLFRKRGLYAA